MNQIENLDVGVTNIAFFASSIIEELTSNTAPEATSTSAIATVDVEKSRIKEKKRRAKINLGSSSIRERILSEPFVPPDIEVFRDLL